MDLTWWIAALFLPLFPFSAVFVVLVRKMSNTWLKGLVFLLWPQPGVWLVINNAGIIPQWLLYWAIGTAILYAFRALVLRELFQWLSFIAASAWSILWIVYSGNNAPDLMLFALGFSLPMALMVLIGGDLEKRFSTVYAGLYGGISESHPRLSAMFVFTLLAVIATPLFPGFFTMMSSIMAQMLVTPVIALGLLLVWLFWSWSGILMLQGLVMGPFDEATSRKPDLGALRTAWYSLSLVAVGVFGLSFAVVF